jgi:hypothetical protein
MVMPAISPAPRCIAVGSGTIPEQSDQITRRADKSRADKSRADKSNAGGRPPDFDPLTHQHRNVIERCFNRLSSWADPTTRYTNRTTTYRASPILTAAFT